MFRAAHRSSSGALNCVCSFWFIYPCGYRPLPRLSGKWQWKMLHPALPFSLLGATVNHKSPINCLVQGLLLKVYVCSCVNKLWAFMEPRRFIPCSPKFVIKPCSESCQSDPSQVGCIVYAERRLKRCVCRRPTPVVLTVKALVLHLFGVRDCNGARYGGPSSTGRVSVSLVSPVYFAVAWYL